MTNAVDLTTLSTVFGGLANVSTLMTYRDLSYIGAFPSKVFSLFTSHILSIYGDSDYLVNLLQYNYVPGSIYSIYDKNYQWLYDSSCSGYWGDSDLDRKYLKTITHGEYCHLHFESDGKYQVFLLWFSTKLTPITYTDSINKLKSSSYQNINRPKANELYLSSKDLINQELIYVHSLTGSWDQGYTPTDIITNPAAIVNSFTESNYLTLRQIKSTWFALTTGYFDELDIYTPISLLKINSEYGIGLERLRRVKSGSYFVHVGNEDNFNLYKTKLTSQIEADEFLGSKVSKIKLFGNLGFDKSFNLTFDGSIDLNINSNTIQVLGTTTTKAFISNAFGTIDVNTFTVLGISTILNRLIDRNSFGDITYELDNFSTLSESISVNLVPEVEILGSTPVSLVTTYIDSEWITEIEIISL